MKEDRVLIEPGWIRLVDDFSPSSEAETSLEFAYDLSLADGAFHGFQTITCWCYIEMSKLKSLSSIAQVEL